MIGSIAAVTATMLARAEQVLGAAISCEAVPAAANLDTLLVARTKRLPAIYVTFLGGPAVGGPAVLLDAEFAVLIVTQSASEVARREGTPRIVGAIPVLERLLPALHGLDVADIGSLTLAGVSNLYAPALDERGISLYSASYRIKLGLGIDEDLISDLAPLAAIHADWLLDAPVDRAAPLPLESGATTAVSVAHLPQGEP